MLRHRILHAASVLITVLSIGFFGQYVYRHVDNLPVWNLDLAGILTLLASIALAAMTVGTGGLIWHYLLRDLKVEVPLQTCTRIFAISQFAKYTPGNFGHHIGRIVLAKNAGISAKVTAQTMVIEFAWAVAVASAIAAGSHLISRGDTWLYVLLMIGAMALPVLLTKLVNQVLPRLNTVRSDFAVMVQPGIAVTAQSCLLFLLTFVAMGLILYLQARHLFNDGSCSLSTLTFAFALSWVAGFLAPGAPAGIGVRETVLVLVLGPLYGSGLAVSLGLSLRLATTAGDALAFTIGLLYQLQQPRERQ